MTGDVSWDELARLLIWDLPETLHPQQLSVFPGCGNPVVLKSPLIRRSSLHGHCKILPMAPYVTHLIRAVGAIHKRTSNELQYFTWNIAWHCLLWQKSRPEKCFNQWDSSEFNLIRPFSWPTTLTFNKSAHSKLHEMYSQGFFLLKSIQPTSRNWDHIFRYKQQPLQSILQSVKFESFSEDKMFK